MALHGKHSPPIDNQLKNNIPGSDTNVAQVVEDLTLRLN